MAFDLPVVMISKSMIPVLGSVAAFKVAFSMRVTASSTSYSVTSLDNLILAKASLILIKDSSCLGVADTVFLLFPKALMSRYSLINLLPEASVKVGL